MIPGLQKYLFLLVLVGALLAFTGYKAYGLGKDAANNAWLEKEVKAAQAYADKILELETAAREKESLANVMINNVGDKLAEVKNDIQSQNNSVNSLAGDIARLRFGTRGGESGGDPGGTVTAASRECNGETITEFSPAVFGYVYGEMKRADEIVEQLSACQEVIRVDREICN